MSGAAYHPLAQTIDRALDVYFDEVLKHGDQDFVRQYAAMDHLGRAMTRIAFKGRALEASAELLRSQYKTHMN